MTVTSAFAPWDSSYFQRTPYLTTGEYLGFPTAMDCSNLVPGGGDLVETFNSAIIDWNAPSSWSALSKKWSATASSTINPGQGFLYYNNGAAANNWVSNFTVQ